MICERKIFVLIFLEEILFEKHVKKCALQIIAENGVIEEESEFFVFERIILISE